MSRWHDKADAFAAAWYRRFGSLPPTHAVILALSVAQHETSCGDAWPGEYNWGACTLRGLNTGEQAAIHAAGLVPTIGPTHDVVAKQAQAALVAAGFPIPHAVVHDVLVPSAAIHCDSAPSLGPYFTWFAAFNDDTGGAEYFVYLLTQARPACKTVLEDTNGTAYQLASAMYTSGYYTGFYQRYRNYILVDGKWQLSDAGTMTGAQLNINAYSYAVLTILPAVRAALADWAPTLPAVEPIPEPVPDPSSPDVPVPGPQNIPTPPGPQIDVPPSTDPIPLQTAPTGFWSALVAFVLKLLGLS